MAHDLKREAAEVIFELLATAYPRLRKLQRWYDLLLETLNKWSESEGNQGVRRMKTVLSQCSKLALSETLDSDIPYLKVEKGIPLVAKPFASFIVNGTMTPEKLTVVLSICRITDLYEGQLSDKDILAQVEIITSTPLGHKAEIFSKTLSEFTEKFIEAYPSSDFVRAWKKNLKIDDLHIGRTSRGPNGPLTENAHLDALTLSEYTVLNSNSSLRECLHDLQVELIRQAETGLEPSFYLQQSTDFGPIKDLKHAELPGKITIIPEKSAKLRLVAQPDYFTQESLAPLHKWVQNVVNTFPTDYTMGHGEAFATIAQWTTMQEGVKPTYIASFDQSSCTDRFPFIVQESVLGLRFGPVLESLVHKVMVDREFSLRLPSGTTRKVRWSVGQPLGLYASWPLMALTHHLIVQWCAYEVNGHKFKKEPFSKYCILGDDIVIADKAVADKYLRTVRDLGMRVNLSKSHVSGAGTGVPPVAEFAKVIIWKGHIIQTVKPKQVYTALRDWRLAIPLFQQLVNHDHLRFKLNLVRRLIKKFWSKSSKILNYLVTVPQVLGGAGYSDAQSMKHKIAASVQAQHVDPLVWFITLRVKSRAKRLIDSLGESALTVRRLPREIASKHPVQRILEESQERAKFGKPFEVVLSEIDRKTTRQVAFDILNNDFNPWIDILLSEESGTTGFIWSDLALEIAAKESGAAWFKVFENYLNTSFSSMDPNIKILEESGSQGIVLGPAVRSWTTTQNQLRVVHSAIVGLNKDKSFGPPDVVE